METSSFFKLAQRLRPRISEANDPLVQLQGATEVMVVLSLLPFAIIGTVWLVLETDFGQFSDHVGAFAVIMALMMLVRLRTFTILVQMTGNAQIPLVGSLSGLVIWIALLVYGYSAVWLLVVSTLISTGWQWWRNSRSVAFRFDQIWGVANSFLQEANVFALLVALAIYEALGGTLPLQTVKFAEWIPAFVAMLVSALLAAMILLPVIVYFNKKVTGGSVRAMIAGFLISFLSIELIMSPFAVLGAQLYARSGFGLMLFYLVGIWLVNSLAHYLSRTNQRSQQRAREMAQLEKLGEAIITAPPDGSTLPDIIAAHVKEMFTYDQIEIRLFDGNLTFIHPDAMTPAEDGWWDEMRESEDMTLVKPKVVLPGKQVAFGEGILVKINDAVPDDKVECLGGIYLLRHRQVGRASDSSAAVQALGSQIASALYRAQVHQEVLAHEKVKQELAFAGTVQNSFLPKSIPDIPGWQLAADLDSARQTSGDFYDVIPLPEGRWALVVADVADKGTGAALFMALSRTLIRTYAREYPAEPGRVMGIANDRMQEDSASDQFVTVFYGVFDPAMGTLTYANAGHNPGYLFNGDPDPAVLKRTGIPLGMMPARTWREEQVALTDGCTLVLYTDGVTEAQNINEDLYGEPRLIGVVQQYRNQSAEIIQTALMQDVHDFAGEAPQADDITLMVLSRL